MPGELSVVIPAAGQGRRMKSYGPKAALPVGAETVVGRLVRMVREAAPEADVVVVLGFGAERVRLALPPGVRTVLNPDHETTNVARSLGLGLAARRHPRAAIVYGDLVLNRAALLPFLRRGPSAVLVDSSGRRAPHKVGVNVVGGVAEYFTFGLPRKWVPVARLSPADAALFQAYSLSAGRARLYGFEVLNHLVDRGRRLLALEPDGAASAEVDSARDIPFLSDFARRA